MMTEEERQRHLEQGRKLLEEKKRAMQYTPSSNYSPITPINSLTIPLSYSPLDNSYYSPNNIPQSTSKLLQTSLPTTPLSSNSPSHFNVIHNYADISGTNHFENLKQNNILTNLNSVHSPNNTNNLNETQKEINNLLQRVNELTIERGELSAKVYKQEKTIEEINNQNLQLTKKSEMLDEYLKSNNELHVAMKELQDKNISFSQSIDQLKAENSELIILLSSMKDEHEKDLNEIESLKENIDVLSKQSQIIEEKDLLAENLSIKVEILENELKKRKEVEESLQENIKTLELQKTQSIIREKEKDQQISILCKESEQKVRENQTNRSNILQLNENIKKLQQELYNERNQKNQATEHLNQQINQLQKQLEETKNDFLAKLNEKDLQNKKIIAEIDQQHYISVNNFEIRIDQLTFENQKLQNELECRSSLLLQLQGNSNELISAYEQSLYQITHLQNELQLRNEEILRLNELYIKNNNTINNGQPSYQELIELRKIHSEFQWSDPNVSIEEMQENKIHQLLEEITLLEKLALVNINQIQSSDKNDHPIKVSEPNEVKEFNPLIEDGNETKVKSEKDDNQVGSLDVNINAESNNEDKKEEKSNIDVAINSQEDTKKKGWLSWLR